MTLEPDFRAFLKVLGSHRVRFVLVGAFAVVHEGYVRTTGDMDVWVYPDAENARRVIDALGDFGFSSLGLSASDILSGNVIQLGRPPVRIDILTSLSGVTTAEVWRGRVKGTLEGVRVFFLGRATLLKNKRASGRLKDLADLEGLGESPRSPRKKAGRRKAQKAA
ncbi:MAG: hypothetical protein KGL53_06115 [Elusimicrobia bacterium]|nr:hypothetical protein [Elusimicrobiota bacterium]